MLKIFEKIIISGYCYVNNHKLIKNGKLIDNNKNDDIYSFFKEVYKSLKINYPKFYKMDNLCKLAFLASELLLQNEELDRLYSNKEIGIILHNSSSTFATDKNFYKSISDKENYFPSPATFVYTLPNIMIGEICIRNNFRGENAFFISEKKNFSELEKYIKGLFCLNKIKCCICGWVEYDGKNSDVILFLVEKNKKRKLKVFNANNMNFIYKKITAM